jgi:hypothetical protein
MSAAVRRRALVSHPTPLEQAKGAYGLLEEWLMSTAALALTFDEVEREQEKRAREVMRLLLQAHMRERGPGDVGPAVAVVSREGRRKTTRRHGQRRNHVRQVLSIFGTIALTRLAYHAAQAASVHPLDEAAALPERMFSYEIQRRLVVASVQGPFDEAVERLEEGTGLVVSKRSAEQILCDAARSFDDFYANTKNRQLPRPSTLGSILVAAIDGKGVPMVKPEKALRVVRPSRGVRANKKRMATVAAVFTIEPRPRTPEEVVDSLFRTGPRLVPAEGTAPRWPGPEHKRVWARLEKSKSDVVEEVVHEVELRDPRHKKTLAVVIDGERGLAQRAAAGMKRAVQILDLLHVTEKLWLAAYCFHPVQSAEAEAWVRKYTLEILRGRVSQVVKGVGGSATKQGMDSANRKVLDRVLGYLRRNRGRMKYHEYLRDGLPIASGSVEGACKNLIKDRMERSGMRWTIPGAEAMLRLRAIYLSGDLDAYWRFHLAREHQRLYPAGRWRPITEE